MRLRIRVRVEHEHIGGIMLRRDDETLEDRYGRLSVAVQSALRNHTAHRALMQILEVVRPTPLCSDESVLRPHVLSDAFGHHAVRTEVFVARANRGDEVRSRNANDTQDNDRRHALSAQPRLYSAAQKSSEENVWNDKPLQFERIPPHDKRNKQRIAGEKSNRARTALPYGKDDQEKQSDQREVHRNAA